MPTRMRWRPWALGQRPGCDTNWQRALVSSALAATLAWSSGPLAAPARTIDLTTSLSALQQQERTVEDLFTTATPSVVYITTFVERTDRVTMNAIEVPAGTGSGFVWDNDGHIVTNYHVVRSAQAAKVVVTDNSGMQRRYDAKLVGYNPDKDCAVLQIDAGAARPPPIAIGSSAPLRVGQTTLAIGNPFGLDHTLTVGVVSGLGREVQSPSGRPITNVIQTDAAISAQRHHLAETAPLPLTQTLIGTPWHTHPAGAFHHQRVCPPHACTDPGNSGGALLDSSGRLIGMNTVRECEATPQHLQLSNGSSQAAERQPLEACSSQAIYSPSGASAGIGFAIPVDTLKVGVSTVASGLRNFRPSPRPKPVAMPAAGPLPGRFLPPAPPLLLHPFCFLPPAPPLLLPPV